MSKLRPRFSLLALLLLMTIVCVMLAWWQFVYLRTQRLLATRDELALTVQRLSAEISKKWEEYMDIARESGRESGVGNVMLELDLKRLDRVDAELMRLETVQSGLSSNGASADPGSLEQRIEDLRRQRDELEKSVQRRSMGWAELEIRQGELKRLQRMLDEMAVKLEHADIGLKARGLSSE